MFLFIFIRLFFCSDILKGIYYHGINYVLFTGISKRMQSSNRDYGFTHWIYIFFIFKYYLKLRFLFYCQNCPFGWICLDLWKKIWFIYKKFRKSISHSFFNLMRKYLDLSNDTAKKLHTNAPYVSIFSGEFI